MARYRIDIDTSAAPAAVFAFLEDFTNAAGWDPGVASAERLDDGPIGHGARFGLDLLIGGRTQRWVYEVTRHEPDVAVTFETRTSRAHGVDAVTVLPSGSGSTVTWDATFRFTGVLGRVVDPLFQPVFTRIAGKAVSGLRSALSELATTP